MPALPDRKVDPHGQAGHRATGSRATHHEAETGRHERYRALVRQVNATLRGTLATAGSIGKRITQTLGGVLSTVGALISELVSPTTPGDATMTLAVRDSATMSLSLVGSATMTLAVRDTADMALSSP